MKLLLATALFGALAAGVSAQDDVVVEKPATGCYLLGKNGQTSDQPFPGLSFCYAYNADACCVAAQDEAISGAYGSLFAGSCVREYTDLASYYCLGCNPRADKYIDWYVPSVPGNRTVYTGPNVPYNGTLMDSAGRAIRSSKFSKVTGKMGELRVCTEYAMKLLYMNPDGDKDQVDRYNRCGMYLGSGSFGGSGELSSDIFTDTIDGATGKPALEAGTGIPQSKELLFFQSLRPTFYPADKFEIRWMDSTEAGATPITGDNCFAAAMGPHGVSVAVAALVMAVARVLA